MKTEQTNTSIQPLSLKLVGGQSVVPAENNLEPVLAFYGGLFNRLPREVKFAGNLARYVGFQTCLGREKVLHFFGIEVERFERILGGMVAWELTEREWRIWQSGHKEDVLYCQQEINWQWRNQSFSPNGRITGEFSAQILPEIIAAEMAEPAEFFLSANAYVDKSNIEENDSISLMNYDPAWPQQFEQFAGWLRDCLGSEIVLRVEHFGSTAIPGIPAKPVIDVLVEIPSFDAAKQRAIPLLNNELWEYWWYSGHIFFLKRNEPMGRRTHHIHMAPAGHKIWQGLAFRDYLRAHPGDSNRYADLKRKLAAEFRDDRERYTRAKTDFVQEILSKIVSEA